MVSAWLVWGILSLFYLFQFLLRIIINVINDQIIAKYVPKGTNFCTTTSLITHVYITAGIQPVGNYFPWTTIFRALNLNSCINWSVSSWFGQERGSRGLTSTWKGAYQQMEKEWNLDFWANDWIYTKKSQTKCGFIRKI